MTMTTTPQTPKVVVQTPLPNIEKGENVILRIAYEALVMLDQTKAPKIHFPYQAIICWGSTPKIFQFRLFGSYFNKPRDETIVVTLGTRSGPEVQARLLAHVKALMVDMDNSAVPKADFKVLTEELLRQRNAYFKSNPANQEAAPDDGFGGFGAGGGPAAQQLETIQQFASNRHFLAKQAVELLTILGADGEAAFERMELAVFFYEKLLNKGSFQLVLNQFSDPSDRENILHRLNLTPDHLQTEGEPERRSSKKMFARLTGISRPEQPGALSPQAGGVSLSPNCPEGLGGTGDVFRVPVPELEGPGSAAVGKPNEPNPIPRASVITLSSNRNTTPTPPAAPVGGQLQEPAATPASP
uniref:IRS-type PTB domain-containing protein n=1 Tax=Phaeomonas parva TaxID=124430 RepID=A0A7S1TZ43_9STRA|mmetsp:Transcript_23571/g.73984  ORF Transcript_23571/g.73984 Transcript_23571/m.73984 type:complete len:356 (+) Transcript_23571:80-1147(+)